MSRKLNHFASPSCPPVDCNTDTGGNDIHNVEKAGPEPNSVDDVFPEGGGRAWMTVTGAWIIQFCTFGYTNAFGVYQDFYVRQYMTNFTSSDISWIGSIQIMLLLSMGLVTGRLYDMGYFRYLLITGSVLFAFCLFMLSLAQPQQYYQVFLSQGLGLGISFGLAYIPSLGIVSHYFRRRRPFAMGIVASGASLGGLIHPIMLNQFFHNHVGFQNGVRYSATFTSILLIVANVLMHPRLPHRPTGRFLHGTGAFARDPAYVCVVIGTVLVIMGLFFPLFFIQLDAVVHGVDTKLAFYLLSILNASSFLGRIGSSIASQSFGIFNCIVPVACFCGILVFGLFGVRTVAAFSIFSVLYGLATGAYIGLFAPAASALAKDYTEIGARMGICFTFTGLGGLVGAPIAGALLTASDQWWRPTTFSGICLCAGSGSFLMARIILGTRKKGRIM